ncbi:f-box domain-containing protein, partial [Cystoisospora suis]
MPSISSSFFSSSCSSSASSSSSSSLSHGSDDADQTSPLSFLPLERKRRRTIDNFSLSPLSLLRNGSPIPNALNVSCVSSCSSSASASFHASCLSFPPHSREALDPPHSSRRLSSINNAEDGEISLIEEENEEDTDDLASPQQRRRDQGPLLLLSTGVSYCPSANFSVALEKERGEETRFSLLDSSEGKGKEEAEEEENTKDGRERKVPDFYGGVPLVYHGEKEKKEKEKEEDARDQLKTEGRRREEERLEEKKEEDHHHTERKKRSIVVGIREKTSCEEGSRIPVKRNDDGRDRGRHEEKETAEVPANSREHEGGEKKMILQGKRQQPVYLEGNYDGLALWNRKDENFFRGEPDKMQREGLIQHPVGLLSSIEEERSGKSASTPDQRGRTTPFFLVEGREDRGDCSCIERGAILRLFKHHRDKEEKDPLIAFLSSTPSFGCSSSSSSFALEETLSSSGSEGTAPSSSCVCEKHKEKKKEKESFPGHGWRWGEDGAVVARMRRGRRRRSSRHDVGRIREIERDWREEYEDEEEEKEGSSTMLTMENKKDEEAVFFSPLFTFPSTVISLLLQFLLLDDICRLALTCKELYIHPDINTSFGVRHLEVIIRQRPPGSTTHLNNTTKKKIKVLQEKNRPNSFSNEVFRRGMSSSSSSSTHRHDHLVIRDADRNEAQHLSSSFASLSLLPCNEPRENVFPIDRSHLLRQGPIENEGRRIRSPTRRVEDPRDPPACADHPTDTSLMKLSRKGIFFHAEEKSDKVSKNDSGRRGSPSLSLQREETNEKGGRTRRRDKISGFSCWSRRSGGDDDWGTDGYRVGFPSSRKEALSSPQSPQNSSRDSWLDRCSSSSLASSSSCRRGRRSLSLSTPHPRNAMEYADREEEEGQIGGFYQVGCMRKPSASSLTGRRSEDPVRDDASCLRHLKVSNVSHNDFDSSLPPHSAMDVKTSTLSPHPTIKRREKTMHNTVAFRSSSSFSSSSVASPRLRHSFSSRSAAERKILPSWRSSLPGASASSISSPYGEKLVPSFPSSSSRVDHLSFQQSHPFLSLMTPLFPLEKTVERSLSWSRCFSHRGLRRLAIATACTPEYRARSPRKADSCNRIRESTRYDNGEEFLYEAEEIRQGGGSWRDLSCANSMQNPHDRDLKQRERGTFSFYSPSPTLAQEALAVAAVIHSRHRGGVLAGEERGDLSERHRSCSSHSSSSFCWSCSSTSVPSESRMRSGEEGGEKKEVYEETSHQQRGEEEERLGEHGSQEERGRRRRRRSTMRAFNSFSGEGRSGLRDGEEERDEEERKGTEDVKAGGEKEDEGSSSNSRSSQQRLSNGVGGRAINRRSSLRFCSYRGKDEWREEQDEKKKWNDKETRRTSLSSSFFCPRHHFDHLHHRSDLLSSSCPYSSRVLSSYLDHSSSSFSPSSSPPCTVVTSTDRVIKEWKSACTLEKEEGRGMREGEEKSEKKWMRRLDTLRDCTRRRRLRRAFSSLPPSPKVPVHPNQEQLSTLKERRNTVPLPSFSSSFHRYLCQPREKVVPFSTPSPSTERGKEEEVQKRKTPFSPEDKRRHCSSSSSSRRRRRRELLKTTQISNKTEEPSSSLTSSALSFLFPSQWWRGSHSLDSENLVYPVFVSSLQEKIRRRRWWRGLPVLPLSFQPHRGRRRSSPETWKNADTSHEVSSSSSSCSSACLSSSPSLPLSSSSSTSLCRKISTDREEELWLLDQDAAKECNDREREKKYTVMGSSLSLSLPSSSVLPTDLDEKHGTRRRRRIQEGDVDHPETKESRSSSSLLSFKNSLHESSLFPVSLSSHPLHCLDIHMKQLYDISLQDDIKESTSPLYLCLPRSPHGSIMVLLPNKCLMQMKRMGTSLLLYLQPTSTSPSSIEKTIFHSSSLVLSLCPYHEDVSSARRPRERRACIIDDRSSKQEDRVSDSEKLAKKERRKLFSFPGSFAETLSSSSSLPCFELEESRALFPLSFFTSKERKKIFSTSRREHDASFSSTVAGGCRSSSSCSFSRLHGSTDLSHSDLSLIPSLPLAERREDFCVSSSSLESDDESEEKGRARSFLRVLSRLRHLEALIVEESAAVSTVPSPSIVREEREEETRGRHREGRTGTSETAAPLFIDSTIRIRNTPDHHPSVSLRERASSSSSSSSSSISFPARHERGDFLPSPFFSYSKGPRHTQSLHGLSSCIGGGLDTPSCRGGREEEEEKKKKETTKKKNASCVDVGQQGPCFLSREYHERGERNRMQEQQQERSTREIHRGVHEEFVKRRRDKEEDTMKIEPPLSSLSWMKLSTLLDQNQLSLKKLHVAVDKLADQVTQEEREEEEEQQMKKERCQVQEKREEDPCRQRNVSSFSSSSFSFPSSEKYQTMRREEGEMKKKRTRKERLVFPHLQNLTLGRRPEVYRHLMDTCYFPGSKSCCFLLEVDELPQDSAAIALAEAEANSLSVNENLSHSFPTHDSSSFSSASSACSPSTTHVNGGWMNLHPCLSLRDTSRGVLDRSERVGEGRLLRQARDEEEEEEQEERERDSFPLGERRNDSLQAASFRGRPMIGQEGAGRDERGRGREDNRVERRTREAAAAKWRPLLQLARELRYVEELELVFVDRLWCAADGHRRAEGLFLQLLQPSVWGSIRKLQLTKLTPQLLGLLHSKTKSSLSTL